MRFFLFLAKGGLIAITPHKTASEIRGRTDKDTSQTKATLQTIATACFYRGGIPQKNISNIWECFSCLKSSLVKNSPFLQCQCIQNQNLVLRSSKFWLIFAQKFDIAKARTFDEEIAKICKRLKSQDDILSYLQDSTANPASLAVPFCVLSWSALKKPSL